MRTQHGVLAVWQSPGSFPEEPGVYIRSESKLVYFYGHWSGTNWGGPADSKEDAVRNRIVADTDEGVYWSGLQELRGYPIRPIYTYDQYIKEYPCAK